MALAANEQWTKVDVGGKTAKLRVDYFDTPMKQPKAKKGRVADRTGSRPWPVARPLLEHLRTDVIPDLERDLGRPPRVLELGSGVGLLGVGLCGNQISDALRHRTPYAIDATSPR